MKLKKENSKIFLAVILVIFVILLVAIIAISINNNGILKLNFKNKTSNLEKTDKIDVVATMNDKIKTDSSWCGTFQLVWNDLKNEVVKKDIVFTPQLDVVKNLNTEDFTEDMLSEDYYFKIYGLKTLELKEQIENGIMEKFNQKSDILDSIDWSEDGLNNPEDKSTRKYFFYVMLYREFEFLSKFDKLDNGKFGTKYNNIEYFGIDEDTTNSVGKQITVLYYNSQDDFAILINTKTDDEVIFCKNPEGSTFNEIYENMNEKAESYEGSTKFKDVDEFKAPILTVNEKREYTELANKEFKTADPIYTTAEILQAIQTIQFTLDEKGGKIKSEAAIYASDLAQFSAVSSDEDEPRYFYVDDTFAIFLREKGKEKPYFAARIDDITKFQ
jgi:hypothetical protein